MTTPAPSSQGPAIRAWLLPLVAASALLGCGGGAGPRAEPAAAPPTQSAAPAAAPARFVPLDACALLTKADVERLTGRTVLDGRKEELSQLVTCSFGDPEAPQAAGRPLSQVLTLSVMTGQEGAYFAGAAAQVKDTFLMARKNAAAAEGVSGLGEDAYWDGQFRTLSVLKGTHLIEVAVDDGREARKLATAVATLALERLR